MNRLLTSAILITGFTSLSFGNLVANGGFEAPVITVPYAFYASGSTALTGWTVGGAAGQGVDQVNATNAGNAAWAHSGVQSVDMTGSPGPGSIRQDLTTTANELYDISFWLTSNGGPFNNSLEVYFDGGLLGTVSSPSFGTWTQHSFSNVVATGALTELKFVSLIGGNAGPVIDDVVVVASVPEPITLLAIVPLAAAIARRRRRN